MRERASYLIILFIALISVVHCRAQSGQPDVVCMGSSKNYYVNATPGSSYRWKINGEDTDTSTTNSVDINWTTSGIYTLTVQEITMYNCVGPVKSLQITVIELPTATISGTSITCQHAVSPVVTFTGTGGTSPYTFTYNINGGTNKTVTTTTGNTVTVSVPTTVSGAFSYNLINVTDSRGFTNIQTCTATITINMPTNSTTKRVICPLQLPYTWNKMVLTSSGIYSKTLVNSTGCDSISTLELVVEDPIVTTQEVRICASELPYYWNGISCKAKGKYTARFTTDAHCDSVATLILYVNPPTGSMKAASFCQNESYEIAGQKFTEPGSYNIKFQNSNGCDSIVTLVLRTNSVSNTSQAVRLFQGETFIVNEIVYNQPGIYTEVIKRENSCDSVVVTEVTYINIPNTMTPNADGLNDTFMEGYRVQIYNRNGILMYEGTNGWDGKYNNRTVSNDTYFYVLYYDFDTAIKTKQGYITVIR